MYLSPDSILPLSPPQRLPLGIPMPRALSFSFSPASPQHKSLPTIQRGLCGGERYYLYHQAILFLMMIWCNKRTIDRFCFLEMGSLVGCAPIRVKLLSHLAKCALKFSGIIRLACLILQWLHTLIKLHLSCWMASLERAVCRLKIILNYYKLKCTNKY